MRRILWLMILMVPVIVVITLPAHVIVSRVDVAEDLRNVQGTLWQGEAVWQQPGMAAIDLRWRWSGWNGWSDWSWQAQGQGVDLRGSWQPSMAATRLADISGRIDMRQLDAQTWLISARPRGELEVDVARAVIADGQPPQVDGKLIWRDARLAGAVEESLGEITVRLDSQGRGQRAEVVSTEPGAIQVRGDIDLGAERYEVDLWLRASAERPELLRQIAWLGEPQPDGQVRVRLSGALGW